MSSVARSMPCDTRSRPGTRYWQVAFGLDAVDGPELWNELEPRDRAWALTQSTSSSERAADGLSVTAMVEALVLNDVRRWTDIN